MAETQKKPGYVDYPFVGKTLDLRGVRMNYVDEGPRDAPPVLMLHGNPTWSFYYRRLIAALSGKHRVIVPDHVGMGLSDKPDESKYDYTLARRVVDLEKLVASLGLRQPLTLVVHDWGGPIGLRIAIEQPERVARIVVMDTGLFTGHQHMSDAWKMFRDFVERTEDLPISMLVRNACKNDPGDEVAAAYDAPFP